MRKIFSLLALVSCLVFATATTSTAQDVIRNGTSCDMLVKVGWGIAATCTVIDYIEVPCPAGVSTNAGIPPGFDIVMAKGTYTVPGNFCPFYVGLFCTPYPLVDNVFCGLPCGPYTAQLFPGVGIQIQ